MASRSTPAGGSGSGGAGKATHIIAPLLENRAGFERQAADVRWNLPGLRAILRVTRNSGQKAVS